MGNVSRDSRLTFIMLWTIADDEGRLRGNSRMLASLLFPYDDDAGQLIDGWLAELESEGCIQRYKIGKDSYVQLCNWLIHQKIDKPSKSKIAPFANPREDSTNVRVGIKDQGEDQGRDQGAEEQIAKDAAAAALFVPAPATLLSMAFKAGGIATQPADPRLIALAEQGVTVDTVTAACAEAKAAKPNERIGVAYVLAILQRWSADAAKVQAGGANGQRPGARPAPLNLKFNPNDQDRSGGTEEMLESMRRRGIPLPTPGEEIEI
jgi:hypothetical protein